MMFAILKCMFSYSIKQKFEDSEHEQWFNVQKVEIKAILLIKGPHQKPMHTYNIAMQSLPIKTTEQN